ncbi:putative sporulation protein [Clostridium pasteurianum DSM 525 = ATCC 6013]|uniref:Putative sporulation protein n=1 Tax=Clostridium pasteurianum DSM 525 = ATCC 6013 TaxID=1262449 RepID=A0A0H3JAH9_CLOPA|nr:sporulation membrane protein YtaF [Clostridium pasteurianum]AJA48575.1 putative sporulation protein [Clostridium pasteurianum DSM 525 = ATCC 6013]AJA52563.1 putative sporulation protein [Clostridium pasteurianum DSM 525 = ATCC 6013]AOZ75806.1 sporulation protein [Clostridium pasteurianum DSM 525 = ATCC 6013]AOZ79602.1 sporulation protein [Clostridium pasteurianum]ELP57947.1 sporulation protein YtaF [Clostridium pasteurianum DSM 525 = ATCC 6013]
MGLWFVVILLIAIVSNTDSLAVGISYGTRNILIPFLSNILIALIGGIGTLMSMYIGKGISAILNPKIAGYMGSAIIIIVGVWICIGEIKNNMKKSSAEEKEKTSGTGLSSYSFFGRIPKVLENPFLADWDFSGYISVKESLVLGIALAVNNMANGIGAGMAGINPVITSIVAFLVSLFAIWIGIKLGHEYVHRWLGKLAAPAAGIILILIGIYEIFF